MTVSLPKVTFNLLPGQEAISTAPQKVLIVGQMVSGTATSGDLQQNIQNNSEEDTLFGATSMIAGMIRGFKNLNQVTQLDAIGLADNGAAVDATGSVVFTGPATADGTITINLGSSVNHSFDLAITSGDTATVIGAALEAAVTADTDSPVTASNAAGTVTITAVNGGTVGNFITLQAVGTVAGVTTTLTAMSSGATDPVLTGVLDVVGNERYQTVVAPFQYGTAFITDFLDPRFNATNRILDGVGILTSTDSFSNLLTTGNAENSESLSIFGNRAVNTSTLEGSACVELDQVISSYVAALRSKRLTEGANINDIVIAPSGSNDNFGGPELASLPYFNTPITPLPLIAIVDEFTDTEMDQLEGAGISVFGNNEARSLVILGTTVSTRKTDDASNPELTFKFLNAVDTSSVVRENFFNNNKARFAQSRLTEGDLVPNANIANDSVIRAFQISVFDLIGGLLVQTGEESRNFFIENLTITLDVLNGLVTINMKVPIVGQLREIQGNIEIVFSTSN